MSTRMERYSELDKSLEIPSRIEKNRSVYSDLNNPDFSKVQASSNVKIIDQSSKEIDLDKIKKYITSLNEEVPKRKGPIIEKKIVEEKVESKPYEENKVYDINSVLERAKEGRELDYEKERYKKLRDTQYDILSKIKMYTEEDKPINEEEFNTNERSLIDLINTVAIQKEKDNLLSELMEDEKSAKEEIVSKTEDIKEAISKEIEKSKEETKNPLLANTINAASIDKSFYTNSMNFSKEDFEVFEELEKSVKKSGTLVKIGVVLLIVLGIATLLVILKFVFNIELF